MRTTPNTMFQNQSIITLVIALFSLTLVLFLLDMAMHKHIYILLNMAWSIKAYAWFNSLLTIRIKKNISKLFILVKELAENVKDF